MTAAIFALAGTLLGVFGTLAVELTRSRADHVHSQREALRLACADFTAAIARMINFNIELKSVGDIEQIDLMREAHREARMQYERLRLIAVSRDIQKAARYALRYTYGLLRLAEGKPPREDEQERGPRMLLQDSLMELYVEVRREIGLRHADDVYREPDEWMATWRTIPSINDTENW